MCVQLVDAFFGPDFIIQLQVYPDLPSNFMSFKSYRCFWKDFRVWKVNVSSTASLLSISVCEELGCSLFFSHSTTKRKIFEARNRQCVLRWIGLICIREVLRLTSLMRRSLCFLIHHFVWIMGTIWQCKYKKGKAMLCFLFNFVIKNCNINTKVKLQFT